MHPITRRWLTVRDQLSEIRRTREILGFFIRFESKTMGDAMAFFPCLCSRTQATVFESMCPVRSLAEIATLGMVKRSFLKKMNKGKMFLKYFQWISGMEESFALYALRIGGRTWMLSQGMDRQFCDFLGTWKSPDASARYYRASPAAVLHRLRRFYLTRTGPHEG